MKKLSGSSGRSLLLLVTNIVLLVLGAITVAAGSILIAIFLLHYFSFASQLFLVTPVLLIVAGALTVFVAIFGLGLFKRKHEASGVFLAYASIIVVALLLSISSSVTSFILREAIAHRFSRTDVGDQFAGYSTDPFIRSRWDAIQREFSCCGGYNVGTGYTDWEGVSIDPLPFGASPAALVAGEAGSQLVPTLSQVPDSCCIQERTGCGKNAFVDDSNSVGTISEKIHVNGCMTVAKDTLFKHVMPLLLLCALVSLVVALIELLLLLCAVSFADHIKRLSNLDMASTIGPSSVLSSSQDKQGIMQDTGEAYLSHEEKQLEYGLENPNPHYYDDHGLMGNEDDSSWFDSSTETRIRHQLPLLDQSPSLRKNRFFFQNSQASLTNGYDTTGNVNPNDRHENKDQASLKGHVLEDGRASKAKEATGIWGLFARLFNKNNNESYDVNRQKELSLREDALDREETLMNVLKSVTTNKSEPDLLEANAKSSSGFSFFGMRSKSKENVVDPTPNEATGGEDTTDNKPVEKLPTIGKTIDKNRKYPPMENLTDAGKRSGGSSRSGLNRLRRIRDEMFRKKHQSLKEETAAKEGDETVVAAAAEEGGQKPENENINYELQKKEGTDATTSSQSSTESTSGATSSSETEKNDEKQEVERKHSSSSKHNEDKSERKSSGRSVHYQEEKRSGSPVPPYTTATKKPELAAKPNFQSGIPIRGSTFQRSVSESSVAQHEEPLRSMSPIDPKSPRHRVSGFGVLASGSAPPKNPRTARHLSLTSNPKLNTIHEPTRNIAEEQARLRTRSLQMPQMEFNSDNELEQLNQLEGLTDHNFVRYLKPDSLPAPYKRSMSPPMGYYYHGGQWKQEKVSRVSNIARSEEQLNKPVVMEYMRPVTAAYATNQIITSMGELRSVQQQPQKPVHYQSSRDNSQEKAHVTRISVVETEKREEEEKEKTSHKSHRDRSSSRKESKHHDRKESKRERSDSTSHKKRRSSSSKDDHDRQRRKDKKEKKRDKKKKDKKHRKRSQSASSGSDSSSDSSAASDVSASGSDSGSNSDSSGSSNHSGSDSDSKRKARKKSRSKKDKESKSSSKHRRSSSSSKKKKKKRSEDSSPEKQHRRKSSSSHRDKDDRKKSSSRKKSGEREHGKDQKVLATFESNTSPRGTPVPPQQQPHLIYDNVDYGMPRLVNANAPTTVQYVQPVVASEPQAYTLVEDPRNQGNVAYYSSATLPSNASLRKPSYDVIPAAPRLVPVAANPQSRSTSEPRRKVLAATNTLDRYTLMTGGARSKSAERVPMKYRKVSLEPYHAQHQYQQKVRSVSIANDGTADMYSNPQLYRTTVEMEPNTGDVYTVQQQPGGAMRLAKASSRLRMEPQRMAVAPEEYRNYNETRRPTHVAEARLLVQGDGSEQISLPPNVNMSGQYR